MQKIVPHLWFDREAKEASAFYIDAFGDSSRVVETTVMPDTPSGDCDVVLFELLGYRLMAISAGPLFKPNPSISFSVALKTTEEADALWQKLLPGGTVLMELDSYAWSERYGWLNDKYGVSWQILYLKDTPITQTITPSLMFTRAVCGKAEEAIHFYTSVFKNTKIGEIFRYQEDMAPDKPGTVAHSSFTLEGQEFTAMDSAREHDFTFSEGVSLMVYCDGQEEIDYYWEKLSAIPEAEQCGWLKDKYGVSWQIMPRAIDDLIQKSNHDEQSRIMEAILAMKKLDWATLEKAQHSLV